MTPPKGLHRCHHPMLDSVIISTEPFITRAFIARGASWATEDGATVRKVAPHSHRSSIKITLLRGEMIHHRDFRPWGLGGQARSVTATPHTYRSVLLGGDGLTPTDEGAGRYRYDSITLRAWPDTPFDILPHTAIHTVEWDSSAVWLVEEGPIMAEETTVLMRDFDRFETDDLYVPMTEQEWAANVDLVQRLRWDRGCDV